MPNDQERFWFFLSGTDSQTSVYLPTTAVVDDLRDAIKSKFSDSILKGVAQTDLKVYTDEFAFSNRSTVAPLHPTSSLHGLGNNGPKPLYVYAPIAQSESKRLQNLQSTRDDLTSRMKQITCVQPSALGKYGSTYARAQNESKYFLRNYRPSSVTPYPASLMYCGFGRLLDLDNNKSDVYKIIVHQEDLSISQEYIKSTLGFVADMCECYESDELRQAKFEEWWQRVFETRLDFPSSLYIDYSQQIKSNQLHETIIALVECKNEIGTSGDPMPQLAAYAAKAYAYFLDNHENHIIHNTAYPMFGIALIGTQLRIYAITLTDAVNIEHLLDIELIFKDAVQLRTLASLLKLVGVELLRLEQFYIELEHLKPQLLAASGWTRTAESDRAELNGPLLPELKYRVPVCLAGNYDPSTGPSFKKLYVSEDGTKIIKLTKFYNRHVHDFCYSQGIAPRLYEFKRLPGGYHLVIMENLSSSHSVLSAETFTANSEFAAKIKAAVGDAMNTLHKARLVHGDFRYENILYREKESTGDIEVKLLDFDFSGTEGIGLYPVALNDNILWHPTAKLGHNLHPEHDQHFFNLFGSPLVKSTEGFPSKRRKMNAS